MMGDFVNGYLQRALTEMKNQKISPRGECCMPFANPLLDELPGMYYRMDMDMILRHCSRGCLALTGYASDELTAQPDRLRRLIHPDDQPVFQKHLQAREGLHVAEYRLLNRQGNYKWVRDQFIQLSVSRDVVVFEGHIVEMQESQMKWQLLHQLKAYRDAVNVNLISSITDTKGIITYVNKNFCDISQYNERELVGQNHRIICSGYHPREFFVQLWKTIADGKCWHGEILNRAKDGTRYWVDTVIIPVFGERDKISHYLSLRTLISGRKEAEKQKDEYMLTLEEIAFIVAHRMRGPLCSIAGLVNLLDHPGKFSDPDQMALHYLRKAVDEMDGITHELSTLLHTREVDLRRRDYLDKISTAMKSRAAHGNKLDS